MNMWIIFAILSAVFAALEGQYSDLWRRRGQNDGRECETASRGCYPLRDADYRRQRGGERRDWLGGAGNPASGAQNGGQQLSPFNAGLYAYGRDFSAAGG